MRKRLTFALIAIAVLVSFQNCSSPGFSFDAASGVIDAASLPSSVTQVQTDMNTPITFTLNHEFSIAGITLSARSADTSDINGTFTVVDAANFQVTYNPDFGYRGKDSIEVTASDAYGNSQILYAYVTVGNPLKELQSAVAIRGMGCIQCHANISSNVITDFGYGNDYYFNQNSGGNWWKSGGIYGDHANTFNTISMQAGKSVLVPAANLPSAVASATGLTTLASYVSKQFAASSNSGTKAANVVAKSSVYIGAPTDADLVAAFRLSPAARSAYYKDNLASVSLAGLVDQGTYFKINGSFSCEGDLVVRGPLYIENMNLTTAEGCRIYVIGSAFIYGPITYATNATDRNLQLTSSRSISLGMGAVIKNGSYCEPGSRFQTDPSGYGSSSLAVRYTSFWTVPGYYVRQSSSPAAYGASVLAEAGVIESGEGTLYDAACRSEGRSVSYDRLLLNAPIVHSRYEGNFSGAVIAEFSIMSLGAFVFSFDSVFNSATILPFLDQGTYLKVTD